MSKPDDPSPEEIWKRLVIVSDLLVVEGRYHAVTVCRMAANLIAKEILKDKGPVDVKAR